jgi:hypothetical protein
MHSMALGKGVTGFNPMLGSTSWALYFGMACPLPSGPYLHTK